MAFFKQLVARGKIEGDIAPNVDADLAAFIFSTIFTELGRYLFQRPAVDNENDQALFESEEARLILKQTLDILEHGMRNG